MRVRYDREEDILMIKVSDEPVDYAEKVNSVIVHFTKDRKPVLFEVMDATEFLVNLAPNLIIDLERARLISLIRPELSSITV